MTSIATAGFATAVNPLSTPPPTRLTEYSQAGGCGCKIEPSTLHQILAKVPKRCDDAALLVGIENSDDAAVYRINDTQALIFSNDFQSPIVDDPYHFGWIASANALSDIYAMGGAPLLANAIVGYPAGKIDVPVVQEIMRGGVEACKAAGIPLAGGHTINNPQPIFGLAAVGVANPANIKVNGGARAGDVLIITKPLGIGVMATAVKSGDISDDGYREFLAIVSAINTAGAWLGQQKSVHGMTDITGFGLAGHLLEMAKGARAMMRIATATVPVMDEAWTLATRGIVPSGSYRNMQSYGDQLSFADGWDMDAQLIFTDPQTNGGLLVSAAADEADKIMDELRNLGCTQVVAIGEVVAQRGTDAPVMFV